MADLLRCRSVMGLPPRDRKSWVAEEEASRRRSAPVEKQPTSPEEAEPETASSPDEVRIKIPELLQLPGPLPLTAAGVESLPAREPPLQRIGLVVDGLDGMG
jgi:hypothetical protein